MQFPHQHSCHGHTMTARRRGGSTAGQNTSKQAILLSVRLLASSEAQDGDKTALDKREENPDLCSMSPFQHLIACKEGNVNSALAICRDNFFWLEDSLEKNKPFKLLDFTSPSVGNTHKVQSTSQKKNFEHICAHRLAEINQWKMRNLKKCTKLKDIFNVVHLKKRQNALKPSRSLRNSIKTKIF